MLKRDIFKKVQSLYKDRWFDKNDLKITYPNSDGTKTEMQLKTKYSIKMKECSKCHHDTLVGVFEAGKHIGDICPVCRHIISKEG